MEWSGNTVLASLPSNHQLGLRRDHPFRQSSQSLICHSLHHSLLHRRHWGQVSTIVSLITVKRKSKVLYLYAFHAWGAGGDRVNPGSDIWVTWLALVNIYVWNCYFRSSFPSGSLPYLTELVVSFEMLSTRRFLDTDTTETLDATF